jgi:general L-amino acid transport system permease protein
MPAKTSNAMGLSHLWHDPHKRSLILQCLFMLVVLGSGYYFFQNTQRNLTKQAVASGFDFLWSISSFEIGESLIDYSPSHSYGRALLVGFLNTLRVSAIGVFLAISIGLFVGIARLSSNWLLRKLAGVFVETLRNVPLLLQLFFWYALVNEALPSLQSALNPVKGVFLSNRGVFFPVPVYHPAYLQVFIALVAALGLVFFLRGWAKRRQDQTGKLFPLFWCGAALLLGLPLLVWLLCGAPLQWDVPVLQGFNFKGGTAVTPEFTALLLGLVLYTGAFIAEIVRAGIQSVDWGQIEAARSLGLKSTLVMRLVVLPQALRVIVPPLTSQMLNLTKNTSLAIAIGYPDFVAVVSTTINQTGQAVEGVAMIMAVYLFFSLLTSAVMNWYNKKIALVEK